MATITVRNPATGLVAGEVREAEPADFDRSVSAAREAQVAWSALDFSDRARTVRRFHDLMLDRSDRILDVIQSETGKARRDAFGEIVSVAGTVRYYLAHGRQHLAGRRRS